MNLKLFRFRTIAWIISLLTLGISFFFPTAYTASASTLSCSNVDGDSIFGWDYDEYIYIGSIASQYNSDSIANEWGHYGSEYSTDSIFNEWGSFGSDYSSYSAFNDYASKPPIIINDDYEFVGYLTVNEYKTPNIHPWEAYACAEDSYKSANSDHEEISFSEIPDSSTTSDWLTDYYIQQYIDSLDDSSTETLTCSDYENTYEGSDGICYCDQEYGWSDEEQACVAQDLDYLYCEVSYGENSYYSSDDNLCYCEDGYDWNSSGDTCEEIEYEEEYENEDDDTYEEQIFSDLVSSDENADAISYLYEEGIISGYSDGSFKPENSLNRAELLKILVEGKGITPDENEYSNCFPDVTSDWYAKYVCYAKEEGWVEGYPDGTFLPSSYVNKVEAVKMLLEVFDVEADEPSSSPYSDVPTSEWYAKYIVKAQELGLLEESGAYSPASSITRGGVSENIYRLLIQL